jgi:hypothetical protein
MQLWCWVSGLGEMHFGVLKGTGGGAAGENWYADAALPEETAPRKVVLEFQAAARRRFVKLAVTVGCSTQAVMR